MGASSNYSDFIYWRNELVQIAELIKQMFPGERCPEPLDVRMREIAKRLQLISEEPERSPDGSLIQARVAWVVEDILDRYRCTPDEAEEFLDEIEDEMQLAMISTGWREIEYACPFRQIEDLDDDDEH